MTELERIIAMRRWVDEASASRVEPWRFGTVIFTDDFPRRYDSNFLRVERALGGATPGDLVAEADRLQSALGHREFVIEDDAEGRRLAAGFRALGWVADRLVVMVERKRVEPPPDLPTAVEVDAHTLRPAILASSLAIPTISRADAEALADFRVVAAERVGTRYFGVELDGLLVAYCELYVHDGVAEVEDVNTLEAWRNRGAGRAVVLAAVAAARAAGADLLWLMADADDWPRHLYERLGFAPVGHQWQFTLLPTDQEHQLPSAEVPAP